MEAWRRILWQQFGAAIEMLDRALEACPDEDWSDGPEWQQFWYGAYHCLCFLDYYVSDPSKEFRPPAPIGSTEMDPAAPYPERVYTKEELRTYLRYGRDRCRTRIESLTEADVGAPCGFPGRDLTAGELLLYNMRHVQHHAAQLHLLLRQRVDDAPPWVSKVASSGSGE